MKFKLLSYSLAILASLVSIRSVNANPSSCKASALTASERKSVEILEDMYDLQAQMNYLDKSLNKLNSKKGLGYDPYNADSVDHYNELIDEYNGIVNKKNVLSNKYNLLKDSFNAIVHEFPLSSNTIFVNCLNIAVLNIDVGTNSLNINSNSLSIDSMNIETENMIRNLENISY